MEMGTSWMFSVRVCAVTTISCREALLVRESEPRVAAFVAEPDVPARMQAIAYVSLGDMVRVSLNCVYSDARRGLCPQQALDRSAETEQRPVRSRGTVEFECDRHAVRGKPRRDHETGQGSGAPRRDVPRHGILERDLASGEQKHPFVADPRRRRHRGGEDERRCPGACEGLAQHGTQTR